MWQNFAWRKGGGSRQDYTSAFSGMPGEPRYDMQHDDGTASRHEEDKTYENEVEGIEQRIRKAGY